MDFTKHTGLSFISVTNATFVQSVDLLLIPFFWLR